MSEKIRKPVTILTGYLGAGKTTVMNEILRNQNSGKIAVIVNDMGKVNIDASLLRDSVVAEAGNNMVELSNGCICCTLQDAFMKQIDEIAMDKNIDRILVEASGISDPSSIAAGFIAYQEMGLCRNAYLDSVVCVADADRIYSEFLNDLSDPEVENTEEDPDIINLVMDQIEFCNLILLNKCDLLSEENLEKVKQTLRILQKEADIVECVQGKAVSVGRN